MSDWSSDVCSSDLLGNEKTLIELRLEDLRRHGLVIVVDHEVNLRRVTKVARQALDLAPEVTAVRVRQFRPVRRAVGLDDAQHRTGDPAGFRVLGRGRVENALVDDAVRSEEHTSELQSLMRISYA